MADKVSSSTQSLARPIKPFTRGDEVELRKFNRARAEEARKKGGEITPETKKIIKDVHPKIFKTPNKILQQFVDSGLKGDQIFFGLEYYEKLEWGTDFIEKTLGNTKFINASYDVQDQFLELINKEYGFEKEKPAN